MRSQKKYLLDIFIILEFFYNTLNVPFWKMVKYIKL